MDPISTFTLSRDQVRDLDRRAIEDHGIPGVVLMENAGRGAAELLMRLNPERQPVVILCGPGNNGGDGFVIARHLDNHGWPVKLWLLRAETNPRTFGFAQAAAAIDRRLSHDCEINASIWSASHPIATNLTSGRDWKEALAQDVLAAGWIVDALFGTGLSRPLAEPFQELFPFINQSGKAILAIDVPSGLDCDTGQPLGPTVRATHTATFVAHKKGFLNPDSEKWTGTIHVIDIGAPRKLVDEYRTVT